MRRIERGMWPASVKHFEFQYRSAKNRLCRRKFFSRCALGDCLFGRRLSFFNFRFIELMGMKRAGYQYQHPCFGHLHESAAYCQKMLLPTRRYFDLPLGKCAKKWLME